MKFYYKIAGVFLLIFLISSCEGNKLMTENEETTERTMSQQEVWEHGTYTIMGEITKVTQKDEGQIVNLKDRDGKVIICEVNPENLQEHSGKYRDFHEGENISFKGEFPSENKMIVLQILEFR